jgi:uncharacterized protein YndB with AHSA1/START domain
MPSAPLQLTKRPTTVVGLLIRSDPHTVYETFADPANTTRIWYSHSTGRMAPGAVLTWTWDFYHLSTDLVVKEAEQDRRLVWEWSEESPQTVEMTFQQRENGTYVEVTETAAEGTGDQQVHAALGSTGGFTLVLCAAKVLVEHGVAPTIVRDRFPDGR